MAHNSINVFQQSINLCVRSLYGASRAHALSKVPAKNVKDYLQRSYLQPLPEHIGIDDMSAVSDGLDR